MILLFQLEQFLLAALDTTISGKTIDYTLLESDERGCTDLCFMRGETCYQIIARNDFEVNIYIINNQHKKKLDYFYAFFPPET